MERLQTFIQLTRLNKPIGFMLLFWPCAWGLTLAFYLDPFFGFYFNWGKLLYFKYLILFFLGSVLMRSAGCIVNDIVDKDLDKKVKRTRKRPIASGKVSVSESSIYVIILCSIAFLILLQFNLRTIILGLGSMLLAFAYPFMKRFTYWPQLFLGLTFNWGIIMSWTSVTNSIGIEPIILYIAAIFWTLGYDTIYGIQDIHDDEIIGVKSTSIKFKNNVKVFVGTCYSLCVLFILLLVIPFIISFIYQIKIFKVSNAETCLVAFKNNNLTGLLIFIFIFSFNIL